jgi:galactokinase
MKASIIRQYKAIFQCEPIVTRAPGRINLIGEHTDYNEGYVLPAAIDKYIYTATGANDHNTIDLYAVYYKERITISVNELRARPNHWSNYVLGVVDQLQQRAYPISGFNLVIDGDLPAGAGLSSSAAFSCAVTKVLNELFHLDLSPEDIVDIAQKAEHKFAGVQCGIMDMYTSVHGEKDHALLLDCRTHTHKNIPLDLDGCKFVLLNTNVKHHLASTAYNLRRQECAHGVSLIQRHVPKVRSLRDVTKDLLIEYVHDPLIHQRCRFVIEENERVRAAADHLRKGHLRAFGQELFRSHEGLTHDYDVSCAELDWLVASVRNKREVLGARMMGGGFGGCTINLVRASGVDRMIEELTETYERFMGLTLTAYVADTADGAAVMSTGALV